MGVWILFALLASSNGFTPSISRAERRRNDISVLQMSGGPTINEPFPNLIGDTQNEQNFDLYNHLGDSWGIVFMHPGDFTPVCTTELGSAALMEEKFAARDCKLVGFSCNDASSHRLWIDDIKQATGGQVNFPLFCDAERKWAMEMGILDERNIGDKGLPLTVRSVYFIKPDKTIALMMTYPASTGRNFPELIRSLDSLQLTKTSSLATPVNWRQGGDVIIDFPLTNKEADEKFGENGYRIVKLPSEEGQKLEKNYLRYTADPSGGIPKSVLGKIPIIKRLIS